MKFLQPVLASLLLCTFSLSDVTAQKKAGKGKGQPIDLRKEMSALICPCIDSINLQEKSRPEVLQAIKKCIADNLVSYQLLKQIEDIRLAKERADTARRYNISIDTNKSSQDNIALYRELEEALMDNCPSLKKAVATNDVVTDKSFSNNEKAMEFYRDGLKATEKEDWKKAIKAYEKAVETDSNFVFAWDNLGISYRKAGEYQKAANAYKRSLELEPRGTNALQNLAIVYQYLQEYDKAVFAFERLAAVDKDNPESYYGMGLVQSMMQQKYEAGLNNLCKAYNMYTKTNSPYRADAQKAIQTVYQLMKKDGKEELFMKVLKDNGIETK
jgi:tetratricopeptide (TPR) repeat protein